MRCDPERAGEAANEMCGAGSEDLAGRSERHRLERVLPRVGRAAVRRARSTRPGSSSSADPRGASCRRSATNAQMGLRLERLSRDDEAASCRTWRRRRSRSILDARLVDCGTDQVLSPARSSRGRARACDSHDWLRGARRERRAVEARRPSNGPRTPMVPVEVVPDLTVVDDEDRPGVMRVRRVGVLVKLGVQHLADAGYRRPPRPNSLRRQRLDTQRTYKTRAARPTVLSHVSRLGHEETLPALILFAVVSSGTPGPNNLLLWASGLQFGFRATVPQILGTSAGIGVLALAVAAGLGVVVTRLPEVELALKLVGSAYLLFLAFQLAGGGAIQRTQIGPARCASTRRLPFSSSTRRPGSSHSPRSARFGPTTFRSRPGARS